METWFEVKLTIDNPKVGITNILKNLEAANISLTSL